MPWNREPPEPPNGQLLDQIDEAAGASAAAVPAAPSGLMANILGKAQKLRLKRSLEGDGGTAMSKRAKVALDFVSLMTGQPDGGEGVGDLGGGLTGESSFHEGSSLSSAEPLSVLSKRQPGKLFEKGLKQVREQLAALQGGTADDAAGGTQGRALSFYHSVIVLQRFPAIGGHTRREMETLCEIVDSLAAGDLERVGDVALQRYKALELSVSDGCWDIAQNIEVLDAHQSCLASEEERFRGSRRQLQSLRVSSALQTLRARGGAAAAPAR